MRYADELAALRKQDTGAKPANWQLSPRAVRTFILGQSEPIELDGRGRSPSPRSSSAMTPWLNVPSSPWPVTGD